MISRRLFILTAVAPMALALLWQQPASAHAHLMAADPAADSTVAAPAKLQIHFSEALNQSASTVTVANAAGQAVAAKPLTFVDAKTVVLTPAAPLTAGTYTVTWTAVTEDDGHKTHGTYSFIVK